MVGSEKRECLSCSGPFQPKRAWQEFCCDSCRLRWYNHLRDFAKELIEADEIMLAKFRDFLIERGRGSLHPTIEQKDGPGKEMKINGSS